jgi:hypothetical protein
MNSNRRRHEIFACQVSGRRSLTNDVVDYLLAYNLLAVSPKDHPKRTAWQRRVATFDALHPSQPNDQEQTP